jgi:ATP synthase protein I
MSQDSIMGDLHRNVVTTRDAADPAHRRGKGAYNALSAASVGMELGLSVAIGLLIGWWLDQHFGTSPWLMLLWLVFGMAAGFRGVLRAVKRADKAAQAQDKAAQAQDKEDKHG